VDLVVIVDYGMGNLGSIRNMLKRIGRDGHISSDLSEVEKADRLILPGVGAFDHGMKRLTELELIPVLNRRVVKDRIPILGICLGMHLMARKSEEGTLPGLGWIDADVKRFQIAGEQSSLKIPHMGWNEVTPRRKDPLFAGFEDDQMRFYFVHSYHMVCDHREDEIGITWYGYDFSSVVRNNNMAGVQFHPEKSHKFGMTVLRNFLDSD